MKSNSLLNTYNNSDDVLSAKLFTSLFDKLPNTLYITNVECRPFMDFLAREQKEKPQIQFHSSSYNGKKDKTNNFELTLIYSGGEILVGKDETLVYLYETEKFFSEEGLKNKAKDFLIKRKNSPQIQLIIPAHGSLSLQYFDFEPYPTDLDLNYNDDLPAFHEAFVKELDAPKSRGLHFLYGKPGTGKTNYLRHIISRIEKDVLYIPSGMAEVLSDPEFLQLLIRAKGDVLIIEDAEKAIISRESSYNNAVSALLNISDGLLSDVLNMQIICTFNTDLRNVDKALLRPGRLLSKYEFTALAPEKAQKLSASLNLNQTFARPTTLAEVYAGQEAVEVSLSTHRGVGF